MNTCEAPQASQTSLPYRVCVTQANPHLGGLCPAMSPHPQTLLAADTPLGWLRSCVWGPSQIPGTPSSRNPLKPTTWVTCTAPRTAPGAQASLHGAITGTCAERRPFTAGALSQGIHCGLGVAGVSDRGPIEPETENFSHFQSSSMLSYSRSRLIYPMNFCSLDRSTLDCPMLDSRKHLAFINKFGLLMNASHFGHHKVVHKQLGE